MDDLSKVTRFEIIDHTPCSECGGSGVVVNELISMNGDMSTVRGICDKCGGLGCKGRSVIFNNSANQVNASVQDNGRTLKVFMHDRKD